MEGKDNHCKPKKRLLFVDNYDSFTWNLVRMLDGLTNTVVEVVPNDCHPIPSSRDFDAMIISPGPGLPEESGFCNEIIHQWAGQKPILGICLGHQAIAVVFGGSLYQLPEVQHGKQTSLHYKAEDLLFDSIRAETTVGLYHSWAVSQHDFPSCLEITALSAQGVVMALRHKEFNIRAVQFHPESVMTATGPQMIQNWLNNNNLT